MSMVYHNISPPFNMDINLTNEYNNFMQKINLGVINFVRKY